MKETSFGRYSGSIKPQYDGWQRTSRYLIMRDGIKIAVDVFLPTQAGQRSQQSFPTLFRHHEHGRTILVDGDPFPYADGVPRAQHLLQHGYALVIGDPRGTGASFGINGYYDQASMQDAAEIINWIAQQAWCDGNIGMEGHSHSGFHAFMTAGQRPPHLKAIFASMFGFDMYDDAYPGGIFANQIINVVSDSERWMDREMPILPTDDDPDGQQLTAARANRHQNVDIRHFGQHPFRDSHPAYQGNSPISCLETAVASGIPIYLWAGWYDVYSRSVCLWYANLTQPRKMTIGPWHHLTPLSADPVEQAALFEAEQLRWFDYWLKRIDNGMMDAPAINYATMHSPDRWTWHQAAAWPLPAAQTHPFYFGAGRSGRVASVNDGRLSTTKPLTKGQDAYTVDYATSSGNATRLDMLVEKMDYGDMTGNDEKGLTYTSDPLMKPLTVTGHPIVTLYLATSANEGDFFVYLEDVTPDGISHYVADGCLRASHRGTSEPLHNHLGLPYHRSFAEDILPVPPHEPIELHFDLQPISWRFKAGHRLRVTLTCADANHTTTPELDPKPVVAVYRSPQYQSQIALPIQDI